mgnify:CR=1 FL=1
MSAPAAQTPSSGPMSRSLAAVGGPLLMIGGELRDIFRMLFLTLYYLFRKPVRWRAVVEQGYEIGNRSLVFVTLVLGFLGMILIYQSAYQAQQIVGDLQLLGALFLQLLFREFAPTITALMIATRVGTGIAAEVGSMVVTEQVDALRMNNADPIQYLVVPRFVAGLVMTVVLSVFAVVVCFLAGMFVADRLFDVSPTTFFNTTLLTWGDLIAFLMKAFAYGIAVPVISAHAGLSAFGGSEGVGAATTKAVVNCSLAVVFLDFLLSGFAFVFLF